VYIIYIWYIIYIHIISYYIHISELQNKFKIFKFFIFKLYIHLLKFIMYWKIAICWKFKIQKFKSDFLCTKCIIWVFSWSAYVDYAPKFNNSYSYFHLSKYRENNLVLNFVFLYIQTLEHDKLFMWQCYVVCNVVGGWQRPWTNSRRWKDQKLFTPCWL